MGGIASLHFTHGKHIIYIHLVTGGELEKERFRNKYLYEYLGRQENCKQK